MRVMVAANENFMPTEEIAARLDWVRPVFTAMRAAAIPDDVAQDAMTYLLGRLDTHLDGAELEEK